MRNKRSFFVRMVSDPKIYNPKIVDGIVKMKSFDKSVVGPFTGMYEELPHNQTTYVTIFILSRANVHLSWIYTNL